jgi:hypothetical protein
MYFHLPGKELPFPFNERIKGKGKLSTSILERDSKTRIDLLKDNHLYVELLNFSISTITKHNLIDGITKNTT